MCIVMWVAGMMMLMRRRIQVSIMVKRLSSFKRVMIVGVHFVDLNNVSNLFFKFSKKRRKSLQNSLFWSLLQRYSVLRGGRPIFTRAPGALRPNLLWKANLCVILEMRPASHWHSNTPGMNTVTQIIMTTKHVWKTDYSCHTNLIVWKLTTIGLVIWQLFWCFTAVLIVDSKMITQIWSTAIVRFCWVLPKLRSIGATKPKLVLVRCRPRNP